MSDSANRECEIFSTALEHTVPVQRAAYLHEACGENAALRQSVESLLRVHEAEGGLLAERDEASVENVEFEIREGPGTRIDRYKLLERIGEGGFGVVYLAEQNEPVRRRVALKIIKPGMDTRAIVARFEAERQALALMEHPNIARVFDGGATETGRPYFVMELVRGIPITRYCDENRLPPEARLRLFITVCQAVQHAHQKGVIHRDLKPSNILVTMHDGVPVAKVIDFGIAKATSAHLTDKTLFTRFHAFIGTPAYTSPEQMEMSGLDVDTRSDIYSLGVLLYELLAGRPPFDPDALIKSGLEAMRRTIREIDPPRPSHRLGTLNEVDRTSVAHARSTDAAKLSLLLRGDVDWIVMHCLEKDRTRRYETANALARDVQRHLAHEPVTARPPSQYYRSQKFVRRHKLAVIAVAAVAVSLVGGLIVSSTLFVREHAARSRAVAAEASESKLRQQAEAARLAEAQRASLTSVALAEQFLLEEGRASEGLAHLVRAARADPANSVIGPRLISTLVYRSFAQPLGEPLAHPAAVRWIYYTKDGRHCVSGADDSRIRTWDLDSGKLLQNIDAGEIVALDLSPDSRWLAVAGVDGNVTIWNIETGQKVLRPLHHERSIWRVQFSPNGRLLGSASEDRTARIWDLETGKPPIVLRHDFAVRHISFSADGTRVLTTTMRGPWRIWRVSDGEPVTPNITNASWANSGAFSPDGKLFAVLLNEGGAQLFDATTGAKVGERMPHDGPVTYSTFTHDGKKFVTTSNDATARIWAVPSGKPLLVPLLHAGNVGPPQLTSDGRHLLTSSGEGVARVWNLATGQSSLAPVRIGDVQATALAADGSEFLTGAADGYVRRWLLASGAAIPLQFARYPKLIGVGCDVGNAAVIFAIERDQMQKIDLLTGRTLGAPRLFPTPIDGWIGFAPDGQRFAVMVAGEVELWDLRGAEIARLQLGRYSNVGRDLGTDHLRFSADGTRFAIRDGSTLWVWDVSTGKLQAGPFTGDRFAFSPDGRQFAFGAVETVRIWDFAAGRIRDDPLRLRPIILGVAFSPDGRLLATASGDGTVQLWDAGTTKPIGSPLPHRYYVRGVAFAPDGRRLLSWTPLEMRMWDVATGSPLTDPMIGGNDIFNPVFNDDGTRIATFSRADRKIRLWGSESGQLIADPLKAESRADLQFLRAGQIKYGSSIWSLPPQSGRQPVPDWLLRLATAFAGGEIDARAVFREQAFDAKAFNAIRRELATLPDNAPYVEWGRWLLADRTTRSIAPGFTITPAEVAKLSGIEDPATAEP